MKNKIDSLRDHLFATLEALSDTENPMDIDRAKAIADVARVVVDSAKAEVEYLKVTGARAGTGFMAIPEEKPALSLASGSRKTPLRICEECKSKTTSDPCEYCHTARKVA